MINQNLRLGCFGKLHFKLFGQLVFYGGGSNLGTVSDASVA